MKHAPGFLKLVDDAKRRIRQIDIEGYKNMVAAEEPHVLVGTREGREWAGGSAGLLNSVALGVQCALRALKSANGELRT